MRQHHLISSFILCLAIGCAAPTPSAPRQDSVSGQSFLKLWEYNVTSPTDPITNIFVRDNLVVAYSKNHVGFWISDQGSFLNRSQLTVGDRRVFPPVVLSDRVAVPTTLSIETFDKSGKFLRSHPLPTSVQSAAAGSGSSLYLGMAHNVSGRLARYNFTDRGLSLAWELYTAKGLVAAPAVWNDAIYAAGNDGNVWAITGSRDSLWAMYDGKATFPTNAKVSADVMVDDYGVFVASQDARLYCIDRTTGRSRWTYYASTPLLSPPFVTSSHVYQTVPNVGLVAIDKTEGKAAREALWVQPLADQVIATDEDHVYASSGGAIVAIDRRTGEVVFRSTRQDFTAFAANPKSTTIFAATRSGMIVAVQPIVRPGAVGEMVMNSDWMTPLASAQ